MEEDIGSNKVPPWMWLSWFPTLFISCPSYSFFRQQILEMLHDNKSMINIQYYHCKHGKGEMDAINNETIIEMGKNRKPINKVKMMSKSLFKKYWFDSR